MSKQEFLRNKVHEELKTAMEKEIVMMREILANMHQEELALNIYDKITWTRVVQERAQMILRLSELRVDRLQATKKLEEIASTEKKGGQEIPLEQLLPIADANSFEILSMRDQMMALIERMNSQNTHNEHLYQQVGSRLEFPRSLPNPQIPQEAIQVQKKKASLATYPRKQ